MSKQEGHHRVCPFWIGYLLASPLRKLVQNPRSILGPFVKPGMTVMDIGPAMGFFTLPMAQLLEGNGRVICVDLQQKMLDALMKRARQAQLDSFIQPRLCNNESLAIDDLADQIDFALAFAMIHEVPDPLRLFAEIAKALKKNGRLLVAEPKGHVSAREFEITVTIAREAGFSVAEPLKIQGSHGILLEKREARS
jgi:ubiquinone/menaquinone biosynthesis C-methylase UbiE